MLCRFVRRHPLLMTLSSAALVALTTAAPAQQVAGGKPQKWCPPPAPPCVMPAPMIPDVKPVEPKKEIDPKKDPEVAPPVTPPMTSALPTAPEAGQAFGGEGFSVATSNVGYIDNAVPMTQFRIRGDAAYGNNRPDRAEFFYPKCGCFAIAGLDPRAPGPPLPERKVDYQEITAYLELALPGQRFSGFAEVPFRLINPQDNANTAGLSDVIVGFKYAIVADKERFVTFQLKTYIPSGDPDRGLGTDHVSVEPGILFYQQIGKRLRIEAELRDWIPIGGTNFAGNVLRYGVGASYEVYETEKVQFWPVVEFVGWSVLNGQEFDGNTGAVFDAGGDQITNVKVGLRTFLGKHASIYAGYGRAVTGAVWYKDMARLELRLTY
ncbi:MAG: transporter [Gemmataceae bacterium]|nr:transporter [Gemmataceae bacterium]